MVSQASWTQKSKYALACRHARVLVAAAAFQGKKET